jgi:hypothetical protein
MSKVTLQDIGGGYNLKNVYNANNDALQEAIDKTLSRTGDAPNQMEALLDMNFNHIINVPHAIYDHSPITLSQFRDLFSDFGLPPEAISVLDPQVGQYLRYNGTAWVNVFATQIEDDTYNGLSVDRAGSTYDVNTLVYNDSVVFETNLLVGAVGNEQDSIRIDNVTYPVRIKASGMGSGNPAKIATHQHSATQFSEFLMARSAANGASHAPVTNGMTLGRVTGVGWAHGTPGYLPGALIEFKVDASGTVGATSLPGSMVLSTTRDGQKSPTAALTIDRLQKGTFSGQLEAVEMIEGGTSLVDKYEGHLGSPGTSGYLLSSTDAGVRSWVAPVDPGATTFLGLTDTPGAYTGHGEKFVKVKATADGLEFVAGAGLAVAWGDITGTLSDQTDLQTALNLKADDNAVVKLTGNQTVAGDKDFTGNVKVLGGWLNVTSYQDITGADYAELWFQDSARAENEQWWGVGTDTTKRGGAGSWGLWAWSTTDGQRTFLEASRTGTAITGITYGNSTDDPLHHFHGYVTAHTGMNVEQGLTMYDGQTKQQFYMGNSAKTAQYRWWLIALNNDGSATATDNDFTIQATSDDGLTTKDLLRAKRGAGSVVGDISYGNETDLPSHYFKGDTIRLDGHASSWTSISSVDGWVDIWGRVYGGSGYGGAIGIGYSRGTQASPLPVEAGDVLGHFAFEGRSPIGYAWPFYSLFTVAARDGNNIDGIMSFKKQGAADLVTIDTRIPKVWRFVGAGVHEGFAGFFDDPDDPLMGHCGFWTHTGYAGLEIENGAYTYGYLAYCGDGTHGTEMIVRRTRGTTKAKTAVLNGDLIGGYYFEGYQSGAPRTTGALVCTVEAAPSGSVIPSKLEMLVGSATSQGTPRLTAHSGGGVTIGAPTGGQKGLSTLNAGELFEQGVSLVDKYFDLISNQSVGGTKTFTKAWGGIGAGPIFVNSASPIIELKSTATTQRHLIESSGPGLRIGTLNDANTAYRYFMDMAVDGAITECIFQGFDEYTIDAKNITLAAGADSLTITTSAAAKIIFGSLPPAYADDAAAATGGLPVGAIYRTASTLKVRVA